MKRWPTCGYCGKELILSHVRLGFCNIECETKYRAEEVK